MCVPDFVASNYEKVTSISQIYDLYFVLYWFTPFLRFGPLLSKNPRCVPV